MLNTRRSVVVNTKKTFGKRNGENGTGETGENVTKAGSATRSLMAVGVQWITLRSSLSSYLQAVPQGTAFAVPFYFRSVLAGLP